MNEPVLPIRDMTKEFTFICADEPECPEEYQEEEEELSVRVNRMYVYVSKSEFRLCSAWTNYHV